MADLLFVLAPVGFFGLCVAYVRGLDRMLRRADGTSNATARARDDG